MRLPAVRANLGQCAERAVKYVANSGTAKCLEKTAESLSQNKNVRYVADSRVYNAVDKYVLNNVRRGLGLAKRALNFVLIKVPNRAIDLVEAGASKIYNFVKSGVSKVWNKIHPAKAETKVEVK